MKRKLVTYFVLLAFSSPVFAAWHSLEKVTKVTVRGDEFYVQGTNANGHACVDESGYYGTLVHASSRPGHKEYYSLALLAQTTDRGLACYIYNVRSNGVCEMDNCHLL